MNLNQHFFQGENTELLEAMIYYCWKLGIQWVKCLGYAIINIHFLIFKVGIKVSKLIIWQICIIQSWHKMNSYLDFENWLKFMFLSLELLIWFEWIDISHIYYHCLEVGELSLLTPFPYNLMWMNFHCFKLFCRVIMYMVHFGFFDGFD